MGRETKLDVKERSRSSQFKRKELDTVNFFNLPEVHVGHDQFTIKKKNLGRQIQLHLGKKLDH
jgi:hypothetical protein